MKGMKNMRKKTELAGMPEATTRRKWSRGRKIVASLLTVGLVCTMIPISYGWSKGGSQEAENAATKQEVVVNRDDSVTADVTDATDATQDTQAAAPASDSKDSADENETGLPKTGTDADEAAPSKETVDGKEAAEANEKAQQEAKAEASDAKDDSEKAKNESANNASKDAAVTAEEATEKAAKEAAAANQALTLQSQINQIATVEAKTGTIKLERDYDENVAVQDDLHVTIDLNGHRWGNGATEAGLNSANSENQISIYGELTITDTSANGTGKLSPSKSVSNVRAVKIGNNGKLNLQTGTITGYATQGNGGAILMEDGSQFTMTGGTIKNNDARHFGGGIYAGIAADMHLLGGLIAENTADNGAGVAANYGDMKEARNITYADDDTTVMENVVFRNNKARDNGGAFYIEHNIILDAKNVTVEGNEAENYGGGMFFNAISTVTFSGASKFDDNEAKNFSGGGMYFVMKAIAGSTLTLNEGFELTGNKANVYGGGVAFYRSPTDTADRDTTTRNTVNVDKVLIKGNYSNERGGGMHIWRNTDVNVTDTQVIENSAFRYGGGWSIVSSSAKRTVFNMTRGVLNDNFITATAADGDGRYGAGLYGYERSTVNITDAVISGNKNARCGGAIMLDRYHIVNMTNTQVVDNRLNCLDGSSGSGAGMYLGANVTMVNCLVSRNEGDGAYNGAGIHMPNVSEQGLVATDCEFSDNHAWDGGGGGIYINAGDATLNGNTVVKNNDAMRKIFNGNLAGGGIEFNAGSSYTLTLEENAVIENNQCQYGGGGIWSDSDGKVVIKDNAEVRNNTANGYHGGGIYCRYFRMEGGKITGNQAKGDLDGGGVYLGVYGVNGYMSGGEISGNSARHGGGICTYRENGWSYKSKFELTGTAVIKDNVARGTGGGFHHARGFEYYIHADENGNVPSIINNMAGSNGGGIYINSNAQWYNEEDVTGIKIDGLRIYGNRAATGRDIYAVGTLSSTDFYSWGGSYAKFDRTRFSIKNVVATGTESVYWFDEIARGYTSETTLDNTDWWKEVRALDLESRQGADADHRYGNPAVTHTSDKFAYTVADKARTVARVGTSEFTTIGDAINAIVADQVSGDIVMIADSVEDVVAPVDKEITLDLNGYILNGLTSVIQVPAGAKMTINDSSGTNLGQIRDGRGHYVKRLNANGTTASNRLCGGGLFVEGEAIFNGGTLCENTAQDGAAVYVGNGGKLTMNGGVVRDNPGTYAICVYYYENYAAWTGGKGEFIANNVTITNNPAGAIWSSSNATVKVSNSTISNNKTRGIYIRDAVKTEFDNVKFIDNETTGNGGVMYLEHSGNAAVFNNCTFTGNKAVHGGAVHINSGLVTLSGNTLFTDNYATVGANDGQGGAIYVNATGNARLQIESAKIYDNKAWGWAKDIYLGSSCYFINLAENGDGRSVAAMGVEGYNAWYDNSIDRYFAIDAPEQDQFAIKYDVKPLSSDEDADSLTQAKNSQVRSGKYYYLTASTYSSQEAVAEYKDNKFATLNAAFLAAKTDTKAAAQAAKDAETDFTGYTAEIKLLADIQENVLADEYGMDVKLNMNGHKITTPAKAAFAFYINNGAKVGIYNKDASGNVINDGESGCIESDQAADATNTKRAVYIVCGDFSMHEGTAIRGFRTTGDGGAIYGGSGGKQMTINDVKENFSSHVVIDGALIENCYAKGSGGAISFNSADNAPYAFTLDVKNSTFRDNKANDSYGGAIYFYTGANNDLERSLTVVNSTFTGNNARYGGAIAHRDRNANDRHSNCVIYGGTFDGNSSWGHGGALYFYDAGNGTHPVQIGSMDAVTTFTNNRTTTYSGDAEGGAIWSNIADSTKKHDSNFVLQNLVVENNYSRYHCGGIRIFAADLQMHDCKVNNNEADASHGAGWISTSTSHVYNCEFNNNEARTSNTNSNYAGITFTSNESIPLDNTDATVWGRVVENCEISGNQGINGGGLIVYGSRNQIMRNLNIHDNFARDYGGGVYVRQDEFNDFGRQYVFENCTIKNNKSANGGGIGTHANYQCDSNIVLRDTLVEGNTTTSGGGAGIYVRHYTNGNHTHTNGYHPSALTLQGDTKIINNINNYSTGGGIYAEYVSITIEEYNGKAPLISGNYAKGSGGGLYTHLSTNMFHMTAGTIENNTAVGNGGGIYHTNGRYSEGTDPESFNLYLEGGVIRNNTSSGNGGGVYFCGTNAGWDSSQGLYVYDCASRVVVSGTQITDNYAKYGGGIYGAQSKDGIIIKDNGVVSHNEALAHGGGVYATATCRVNYEGGVLYDNKASLGQDVYCADQSAALAKYYDGKYNIDLMMASKALAAIPGVTGTAWLDENTSKRYSENAPHFNLRRAKAFPLTLNYITDEVSAMVNGVPYLTLQQAIDDAIANKQRDVVLVADTTECIEIPAGADIKLNLYGYKLTGGGAAVITAKGAVEICDDKTVAVDGHEPKKNADGTLATGAITGSSGTGGGGVRVEGGTVKMTGGQITECGGGAYKNADNNWGGGVYVKSGSFELAGGSINNCSAYHGGGVCVYSTAASFSMTGGEIRNCKAWDRIGNNSNVGVGGAIYNRAGTVKIYSGLIDGNTASQGGAIYNHSEKLSISGESVENGPVFSNNVAVYNGGVVYQNGGNVNAGNATFKNNSVTANRIAGDYTTGAGGVFFVNDGTLFLNDGATIIENTARRGAAVHQTKGTVYIMGATITRNTADVGGACTQHPTPGITTARMIMSKGQVYGNISRLNTGNDFYSHYEGTANYQINYVEKNTAPKLTLISAASMDVPGYNVWKNEAYNGSNRTGDDYLKCEFVTSEIMIANDARLSAANYDADVMKCIDSDFEIDKFKIVSFDKEFNEIPGIQDGTANFDNGAGAFEDASSYEKSATKLLEEGDPKAVESTETYVFNGEEFNYIEYDGKLYERDQAVQWKAGCDYDGNNGIVRSHDSLSYQVYANILSTASSADLKGKVERTYRLWIESTVEGDSKDIEFNPSVSKLTSWTLTSTLHDGKESQTLRGYWEITVNPETWDNQNVRQSVAMNVHGLKNGSTVKPNFKVWIQGNEESENAPSTAASKTITVSAAPSYNVSLKSNSQLARTGWFDLVEGIEVSNAEAEANPENKVYGTMLGYGISVQMYNEQSVKNMKGFEAPQDGLEFDLNLKGQVYYEGEAVEDCSTAPYIWAYKPNDQSNYGRPLNGTSASHNMNWNDEDDLDMTTRYAYDAAPFSSGGGNNACYQGGGWLMTGSQPAGKGTPETTVHMKATGYSFDNTSGPSCMSNGASDETLKGANVKAFTAAYVQVLFPLDFDSSKMNGYVEIAMNAAVSKLNAKGLSGITPDEANIPRTLSDKDWTNQLESMNAYFGFMDEEGYADADKLIENGLAVNERRYADNQCSFTTTTYIYNDESIGEPDARLSKLNHIANSENKQVTDDSGNGELSIATSGYLTSIVKYDSKRYITNDSEGEGPDFRFGEDDPLYSTDCWNADEYNYLTSLNILQRFDPDAFTLVGCEPIINKRYNNTSSSITIQNAAKQTAFVINTGESELTWSTEDAVKKKPMRYNLTILYAAIPDKDENGAGRNWEKVITRTETSANGVVANLDDGGATEMDKYKEENLIYFESLDDLNAYFGGNGKCVGILYEFRDCLIRRDRPSPITVQAKMNVTDDFEKTGNTYCITNEVRGWYTYRPYYKVWTAKNVLAENLHSFDWVSQVYGESNGVTAYGMGSSIFGADEHNHSLNSTQLGVIGYDGLPYRYCGRASTDEFRDLSYIKTQWKYGVKVPGTHNGARRGNSVLLYTLRTGLSMGIYTKQEKGNGAKVDYDIYAGERLAEFVLNPEMSVETDAKKSALVNNGSMATTIDFVIELPAQMTYQDRSIWFEYFSKDYQSGYKEGDLNWDIKVGEKQIGKPQTITVSVRVTDADIKLPRIHFGTKIGEPEHPKQDILSDLALSPVASIHATYEEFGLMAAEAHSGSATVWARVNSLDGLSKIAARETVEMGEDLVYNISYNNATAVMSDIAVVDVLPYNGDGRDTSFTGGYRVKTLSVNFSNDDMYRYFLDNGAKMTLVPDKKVVKDTERVDLLNSLGYKAFAETEENEEGEPAEPVAEPAWLTMTGKNDEARTVEFQVPDDISVANVVYGSSESAPCLYMLTRNYENAVNAESGVTEAKSTEGGFTITMAMTPMEPNGVNWIEDPAPKNGASAYQENGSFYGNVFFAADGHTVTNSAKATIGTLKRAITGVVWMDQDRDGTYFTPAAYLASKDTEREVEYPLANVDVALYSYNSETKAVAPVLDAAGQPRVTTTANDGYYRFDNVPEGQYVLRFYDEGNNYTHYKASNNNLQPIAFDKLTVSPYAGPEDTRPTSNKMVAKWTSDGENLDYATLGESAVITMPNADDIRGKEYVTSNWNLGLYYTEVAVQKTWKNMKEGIPNGATLQFDIDRAKHNADGELDEYAKAGDITMEKTASGVNCSFTLDGNAIADYGKAATDATRNNLQVSASGSAPTYTWKLSRNVALQAANANGPIEYRFSENADQFVYKYTTTNEAGETVQATKPMKDDFVIDYDTTQVEYTVDKGSGIKHKYKIWTFAASNTQTLHNITVRKVDDRGNALQGAQFGLYKRTAPLDADSVKRIHESGTDRIALTNTAFMYKSIVSAERFLEWHNAGYYDAVTHTVLLNKVTYPYYGDENGGYYYVPTNVADSYLERAEDGTPVKYGIVQFKDLSRWQTNGENLYALREIAAPAGCFANFELIDDPYVPLDPSNAIDEVDAGYIGTNDVIPTHSVINVMDKSGHLLPVFGGMGTEGLTLIGAALMLLAGGAYLMVSRRRKEQEKVAAATSA